MYIRDKYKAGNGDRQVRLGEFYFREIEKYLRGWLKSLDTYLDRRLVVTFADLFISILRFRNRSLGLLLSELGSYVAHPTHAPAGTKRISNLLRSGKWTSKLVEDHLLGLGPKRVEALKSKGQRVLFLWDDSVVEKPESWFTEGLCAVGSGKAKRLMRVKRGYYAPPAKRVCVPGFEWSSILMTTLEAVPSLVMMRWWTTRGKERTDRQSVFPQMLKVVCKQFKDNILHVLDRGFASEWTLEKFFRFQQVFLIRWVKTHLFLDETGKSKKVSRFFGPKDAVASRLMRDAARNTFGRVKLFYATVRHPAFADQALTLITCKPVKAGQEPMHLITNETVHKPVDAWKLVFAYMRRYSIEQTFRYNKSELALESPRLWRWQNRLKIMAIVSLVYDFLLQTLRNWNAVAWIAINTWCPRTGKKLARAKAPLYRLRAAIHAILNESLALDNGPPT